MARSRPANRSVALARARALGWLGLVGVIGAGGCDGNATCVESGALGAQGAWQACAKAEPSLQASEESCCQGLGWCFQGSILPASQAGQLSRDSCPSTTQVCVPRDLAVPGYIPPTCRFGDAEGRCLSECLPVVAERSAGLPQSTCADSNRCVPCYDPISGGLTGACNLTAGDMPAEAASVLASCCGGVGRCVAQDRLTDQQRSRVQRDSCAATTDLCVPVNMIASDAAPPTCRAVDDAEGRCLSTCLPSVAMQASQLPQASCQTNERCVPCFDPFTGNSTGACSSSPKDHPSEMPKVFAHCCGGAGSCIPQGQLTDPQKKQVQRDTCSSTGDLCVPQVLLDSQKAPPSCRSVGNAEGRCLPTCLPSISPQASRLLQATCDPSSRCAPCFDPLTGAATGACSATPADSPKEPPYQFPWCCGGIGRCVPQGQLTDAQKKQVQQDACSSSSDLCVPQILLDAQKTPPTCRSVGNAEGRCLPTCLPSISGQASQLPQATCDAPSLCAPCFNPITGASTGACNATPADSPKEAPYLFPTCCNSGTTPRGTCVPTGQVPASLAANLSADTCASSNLCAPTQKLLSPTYMFPRCTAQVLLVSTPGACIPDCLPAAQGTSGALLSSTGCQAREKCAPCTDPTTGKATGACN